MRTRQEIETEIEPLKSGTTYFGILPIGERLILEVLLDIRDIYFLNGSAKSGRN
jgi:hypothetical protein